MPVGLATEITQRVTVTLGLALRRLPRRRSKPTKPMTEIESFSDDDVEAAAEAPKKPAEKEAAYKPLTLKKNTETQLQLRLLRKIRKPADITDRTAQWVADKFLFSSRYVMDMLQGDTPWPGWSRAQLFNVCNRISALYEQVELRERTAKDLSESTRKEMLKSESKGLRDIRLMLNIARLGPGGGEEYRQMVLTEKARSDFEASFADPKAFKLFRKMYNQVQGDPKKPRTSRASGYHRSSGFLRSRRSSGFRPYRTQRTSTRPTSRGSANRRSNHTHRAAGARRSSKTKPSSKCSGSGSGVSR